MWSLAAVELIGLSFIDIDSKHTSMCACTTTCTMYIVQVVVVCETEGFASR